jgi:hypothetical protein
MAKTICTSKGVYFDFEHPEKHPFDIEEIAHALSLQCRYTGHCRWHYSIAQHSVLVSYQVPHYMALTGLMHDASEAYLGDVSTHLKSLLPDYKVIERRTEGALAASFNLLYPLPEEVKLADGRMLLTEVRDLIPNRNQDWPDFEPYDFGIARMQPNEAKELFLNRYYELTR